AHARSVGALTALITSNPRSPLRGEVDVELILDTGPEALAGSTRMKSATAQKLVLHTFSTALMVRLGRTWSNLMVSMVATNQKLRARALTLLGQAAARAREECAGVLDRAAGDLKRPLVRMLAARDVADARAALERAGGTVRPAIEHPTRTSPAPRTPA